jgi:hypothetical protein
VRRSKSNPYVGYTLCNHFQKICESNSLPTP